MQCLMFLISVCRTEHRHQITALKVITLWHKNPHSIWLQRECTRDRICSPLHIPFSKEEGAAREGTFAERSGSQKITKAAFQNHLLTHKKQAKIGAVADSHALTVLPKLNGG